MRALNLLCSFALLTSATFAHAEILPEAQVGIKIPLVKKPTTRPMTVAHIPGLKRYYIADGGLAPMGGEGEVATSKSQIHAYDEEGNYINSANPGYDNRSLYYNPNTYKLETVTYNVSSDVGFAPNSGIFSIDISETGEVKNSSSELFGFNPAFGDSATMPSYNPNTNQYYAKQERGNKVWVVETKSREKISEIALDLKTAGAEFHDISDHFIGYSGIKGEELVVLDVDHKAVLIFDLSGKYVGRSELPKDLKLRSQNHFNGTGYANDMLFVYNEPEGEFGTYYGFKVLKNN